MPASAPRTPDGSNREPSATGNGTARRRFSEGRAEGAMTTHADPKTPGNDPGWNPTGPRTHEDRAVRPNPQGPLSPGATEPGDMGAFEGGDHEAPPGENTGRDRDGG